MERSADNSGREFLGVNFFRGPEAVEKQGRKIRDQNLPSKSAEIFAEIFAGNFPKTSPDQKKTIHPNLDGGNSVLVVGF